jgi:hypothetical protein
VSFRPQPEPTPTGTPQELRGLVGGKIREETIVQNWPDILRSAATMVAGIMPPSQLLRNSPPIRVSTI